MSENPTRGSPLADAPKQLIRRLMMVGENRLELLAVEFQEERERLLRAIFLALAVAVLVLLCGITLTAGIVVWLRAYPVGAILGLLTLVYGVTAWYLARQLHGLQGGWQTFPETINQLKKDCQCFSTDRKTS